MPIRIRTISTPPLCQVYNLVSFENQSLNWKPIGTCFYSPTDIRQFMLDNGIYRCSVCWIGEMEHWYLDGQSVFKYP